MKRIKFYYATKLTFDDNVHEHSFSLRCIPQENERQKIEYCSLKLSPEVRVNKSQDAFGNGVVSGFIGESHRFLDFTVTGIAEVDSSAKRSDFMPCYRGQSAMTKPDMAMLEFYAGHKDNAGVGVNARAQYFSNLVYEMMVYERGCTDTETTAAQAFAQKKGVCQDYTHILLTLLRLDKIPCRYVAGLAFCDGETHSWAEYWNGEYWTGIDPTNNCYANDDYIVLTQGRDYRDCAVSRGVMFGKYTRQIQLVETNMETLY